VRKREKEEKTCKKIKRETKPFFFEFALASVSHRSFFLSFSLPHSLASADLSRSYLDAIALRKMVSDPRRGRRRRSDPGSGGARAGMRFFQFRRRSISSLSTLLLMLMLMLIAPLASASRATGKCFFLICRRRRESTLF